MTLTLDEIVEHEERLRREIVERECLLAAFKVLHGYAANGQSPKSMEMVSFVTALSPSAARLPLEEPTIPPPAPAPEALPTIPVVPPYMHPELRAIGSPFGSNGMVVSWAIKQMTEDYTLNDIASLLKREGYPMRSAEISVVLTRLKGRGEIEEVRRGGGRTPAVFRKPESPAPQESEMTGPTGESESTTELSTAA